MKRSTLAAECHGDQKDEKPKKATSMERVEFLQQKVKALEAEAVHHSRILRGAMAVITAMDSRIESLEVFQEEAQFLLRKLPEWDGSP